MLRENFWTGFSVSFVSVNDYRMMRMLSDRDLREQLRAVAAELGLEISELQEEQFLQYINLLHEGQKQQRLLGDRSEVLMITKHVFDSLYPLKWRLIPSGSMLDLGTGAGLPGIPLKILLPGQELYLLDARARKINFLRRVVAELKLQRVNFLTGRAEEWGRDPCYREKIDCVFSRAVAHASVLVELGLPLVKMGGALLLYKGKQGGVEIESAAKALQLCGGSVRKGGCYNLPTGEERTIYLIEKVSPTPEAYPRRAGRPSKKPLGN